MRNIRKPHPDWGYAAPAPGVVPAVRNALIGSVIGAIGFAVVVVSLIGRPGSNADNGLIAAHAVFSSGQIISMPTAAPKPSAAPTQARASAAAGAGVRPAAEAGTTETGSVPKSGNPNEPISPPGAPVPSAATSAESPPTAAPATVRAELEPAVPPMPVQESPTRKRHLARNDAGKHWRRSRHTRLFDEYGGRAWRNGGAMHDEW
jgi:hypothetical protein